MTFEFVDIHSHLYFKDYDSDREEVIAQMKKKKIGTISVGTGFETSLECLELAEKHENVFACVGQHPGDIDNNSFFDSRIVNLATNKKVVALGEVGLDYYRMDKSDDSLKKIQKEIFEKYIQLSLDLDKPLMLHIRGSKGSQDAYFDALDILERYHKQSGGKLCGNAHFFAGDTIVLKRFLAIGFTISFTGVITFTHDYDELVREAPLSMIMTETDAPFVAPNPYRGKRNSPCYVDKIVERIAELKGLSPEDTKTTLLTNVSRVFGIN